MFEGLKRLLGSETKSALANPSPELFSLFGGAVTESGVTVTVDGALRVPTVQSAIRVISEAAASLNIRVVEIDADGKETDASSHPAWSLLRDRPNDWSDKFDFIRALVVDALCRDHGGLAFVNWVDDRPVELIKYPAGVIQADISTTTGEPVYRINNMVQNARKIVHVRNAFDRSPISLASQAIGILLVMERFTSKFFSRAARPGGVIEAPTGMGEEAAKRMISAWRAAQEGAENAGRTPILFDGAKFVPQAFNSVDAQYLELKKFQILEVANAFRVPPSMLYQLDRSTWSNSEQMGREFLTYTLEPWLQAVEGALRRALFLPEERSRYAVRFDRDDLTRADFTTRFTGYASGIASRIINPNQAREWEGLPPYDGGEVYANPNTGANQPGAAAPQEGQS